MSRLGLPAYEQEVDTVVVVVVDVVAAEHSREQNTEFFEMISVSLSSELPVCVN